MCSSLRRSGARFRALPAPPATRCGAKKVDGWVDEVTENPERFDEFMVLEREFHIATFAGADFPGYRDRVEQLWNRTQFSRGTVACQFTAADWACTRADHHLMRYYIDNCDAEALGEIVRLHIRRTRRLGAQLELLKDQSIGSN